MSETKKPQLPVAPEQPASTSQSKQDSRLGVLFPSWEQIAIAPNYKIEKSELFSISERGQVYRISPEPGSDTGWDFANLDFPGRARRIAAAGSPDGAIEVYVLDVENRIYSKNDSFNNGSPNFVGQQTGAKLTGGWQRLPDPAGVGDANEIEVGYDNGDKPFVVLDSRVDQNNTYSFFILLDRAWSGIGPSMTDIHAWSPALVPFFFDEAIRRGVYVNQAESDKEDDRIIIGETRLGQNQSGVRGPYSKVKAANSAAGYSAVFAISLSDLGLYYLANPSDENLSTIKISNDTTVKTMAAGSTAEGLLEVFAISSENFLYHTRQDPKSQTGWEAFVKLNKDVKLSRLVVGRNPRGDLDVFAVTITAELFHIWQDPETNQWHFDLMEPGAGSRAEILGGGSADEYIQTELRVAEAQG